jgi:peroxiredoxin
MNIAVRISVVAGLAVVVTLSGAWMAGASAAKLEAPKIGTAFPDFKLPDTTGKEHALSDYKGKILVLNFSSQECPFSRGADPAISELATAYKDKGVVFLGVDSNKDLDAAEIQAHIDEAGIPYAILKDAGNKLADAAGARVTPEIYVINKDGKLAYHGAPDDRAGPTSTPTAFYLKDALEALTAGKAVEKPTVKAWGCGIKRAG